MYGYTSHIPRQQELCDWLNSIPNSWSGTQNYYHYNSNYTPSSADKLLQINSSGSAEFAPTGVYYTNTATSKFIREEEVRTYRFQYGTSQYYDYGTVTGITLSYNGGNRQSSDYCAGYMESIGPSIKIDHITMNDSSRTPNYAEVSDFEKSPYITLVKSGNVIQPQIYIPSTNCYINDRTGYVKHKATNTQINYTWRETVNKQCIFVEPIFTTRASGINIVRFYAKMWLTGYDNVNDPNTWDTIDWSYSSTYPNHYRGSYIGTYSTGACSCYDVSTSGGSYIEGDVYLYLSAIAIDSSGTVYDVGCYGNPQGGATVSNLKNYSWVQANPGYAQSFQLTPTYVVLANGEHRCSVDNAYIIFVFESGSIGFISNYANNQDNCYSDAALDQHAISCGYSGYQTI